MLLILHYIPQENWLHIPAVFHLAIYSRCYYRICLYLTEFCIFLSKTIPPEHMYCAYIYRMLLRKSMEKSLRNLYLWILKVNIAPVSGFQQRNLFTWYSQKELSFTDFQWNYNITGWNETSYIFIELRYKILSLHLDLTGRLTSQV